MSIMNICKLEESTWNSRDISLRHPCRDLSSVDISSEWLRSVLSDMYETLYSTPSGIGLAAPQVGLQLKIVVIDIKRDTKKPLVLFNPSYIGIGDPTEESTESCLSVPGVVGKVLRYNQIVVTYVDLLGMNVEKECTGFEAVALQHEIDHTDGIVYVDKLIPGTEVESAESHIHRLAIKSIDNAYTKVRDIHNEK